MQSLKKTFGEWEKAIKSVDFHKLKIPGMGYESTSTYTTPSSTTTTTTTTTPMAVPSTPTVGEALAAMNTQPTVSPTPIPSETSNLNAMFGGGIVSPTPTVQTYAPAFGWSQINSNCQDVAFSITGDVWVIGPEVDSNGGNPSFYNTSTASWTQDTGITGVRIAIDSSGGIWVVQASGAVQYASSEGQAYTQKDGICAQDIAIGMDGSVFVLSCVSGDHGQEVLKYNTVTDEWIDQLGSGVYLAAYIDGLPLTIGDEGNLYKMNSDGSWSNYGGCY